MDFFKMPLASIGTSICCAKNACNTHALATPLTPQILATVLP